MIREGMIFTMKEVTRFSVIDSLMDRKMTNQQAASALDLSRRQVQRLKKRVEALGPAGVCHGNRRRRPAHAFDPTDKRRIIDLAETRYFDFNFSHLADILDADEGIAISRETLRRWLRPRGFGHQVRRMPKHRRRRPRSRREGERLFLDGSPHRWFRDEETTLILCTDDATGAPLYGLFQKHEDLEGCLRVCMAVFSRHGLPLSFYLDRASQFKTTRHGGLHVSHQPQEPTQFQRAMNELGIALIFAHSPQARGRAERINGTLQDRLVAELRLRAIHSCGEATRYLNRRFIPQYRKRFGQTPQDPSAAWRAIPPEWDLRNILCNRYERTVNNDNTVSVNGQILQLLPSRARTHFVRAKIRIHRWVSGSWHAFHPTEGEIPCVPLNRQPVASTTAGSTGDDTFTVQRG